MKRLILTAAICVMFLWVQTAGAFPGEGVLHRTTHFAHKVAHKIDNHVVHPVAHGIKRHLR
jgi:hypothetical protein